ncbi:MAG: TauD/TfdA family dioxygenase [Gammaproteobacteria bacterium]|nr:TauD/TfdA family dioxygenase [Gammaproteobacteria bacterium]
MDQYALSAIGAWNSRQRPDYKLIKVTPINPSIGAEVEGVDLTRPISPELFAEINTALNEHHAICFRDQKLSDEDHKRFGRMFGKLHSHPGHAARAKAVAAGDKEAVARAELYGFGGDPEILQIKADEASKNVAGEGWHTDVTCDLEPPMGSMLYISKIPGDGGGATMFMNMHLAYETLSPTMQKFLEGLTAIHNGAKPYTGNYGVQVPEGGWPESEHPVVCTHPGNGRKMLYVNSGFTVSIPQLAPHESDALLNMLFQHCASMPELHCRVQWTPNMLTLWDNRCTQHHAVWDYFPARRVGQRVSIIGERPAA